MDPLLQDWFARRTWPDPPWTVEELLVARRGRSVSVVLPALDEEATVGGVVAAVTPLLGTLVDEVVVVDSGSTDATAAVAAAAGARVVTREAALPGVPVRPGKGEVLWRALAATSGDLLVYLDSDLVDMGGAGPRFVTALLGPLLTAPGVALVKGFYARPLRLSEHDVLATGGGRVTELVARPALASLRPELAGVVQPLGGEYAATRELLESLPFAGGYGVEIGLLLDTHTARGLDAIAQVDLGVRKHRHRTLRALGVTAAEVLDAALRRCVPPHDHRPDERPDEGPDEGPDDPSRRPPGRALTQFVPAGGSWRPEDHAVATGDRPPMGSLRAGVRGGGDRGTSPRP